MKLWTGCEVARGQHVAVLCSGQENATALAAAQLILKTSPMLAPARPASTRLFCVQRR